MSLIQSVLYQRFHYNILLLHTCRYSLISHEVDVPSNDYAAESTHKLSGDFVALELTAKQVEPLHLDKVGLSSITSALEVSIQHL